MLRSVLRFVAATVMVAALAGAPAVETGEIAGAKFALARAGAWNGAVLLLAHGYRAEGQPLVADLFPEHLAYRSLLDEGWIVAKTSYRRNGIIVADAIKDLDALRAHIAGKYGAPKRVLLEGDSMGGLIVTLIAERQPAGLPLYHGAVAIGAALQVREPGAPQLTSRPQIPLLFLTNQSELDGPRNYVAAAQPADSTLQPVLWRVSRDGHVNVNQRERLAALRGVQAWLDRGRTALPTPAHGAPFHDATIVIQPGPSRVTVHADRRGFDVRVLEVSAIYGNVLLDAQPGDFAAAGIAPMTWFELKAHGETFRVLHGRGFGSVQRGEWVTFANADGLTWLARNQADAATTAKLRAGDRITLRQGAASAP